MPGVWFDELSVGQRFDHAIRRTVTETDNVLFTTLSHNPAQLHLDAELGRLVRGGGHPVVAKAAPFDADFLERVGFRCGIGVCGFLSVCEAGGGDRQSRREHARTAVSCWVHPDCPA